MPQAQLVSEHFVSLVTFCSCETCNVFDKVPVGKAHPLSMNDYEPCCSTPLYDAMGFTLTAMYKQIKDIEDIITLWGALTKSSTSPTKGL